MNRFCTEHVICFLQWEVPRLAQLGNLVWAHREVVLIASAVTALICGCLFLFPRDGSRIAGRWSKYVGWAFLTFFIIYSFRYLGGLLLAEGHAPATKWLEAGIAVVVFVCSGINNLLFLAAARILLNRDDPRYECRMDPDDRNPSSVELRTERSIHGLRAALPRWAWVAVLTALVSALGDSWHPFVLWRLPDAIFSIYCLGQFGYAVAVNFNVRHRSVLSAFALMVALFYGVAQAMYACVPIISTWAVEKEARSSGSLDLGTRIASDIMALSSGMHRGGTDIIETPQNRSRKALRFTIQPLLLLPLKFLFVLPSFILYLLIIISGNDFRKVLDETNSRKRDFLSGEGVVRAIRDSLSAKKVELFVRLPGSNQKRLSSIGVALEEREGLRATPWQTMQTIPTAQDALLERIMNGTGELKNVREGSKFMLLAPIRFHGAVIGILRVEIEGRNYSYAELQQVRFMAQLLAPSLQDFRALTAIDQISHRFARVQVDDPSIPFEEAVARMADILHDVLCPLGTGLFVESGFKSLMVVRAADRRHAQLIHDLEAPCPDESNIESPEGEEVRTATNPLIARTRTSGLDVYPLGSIMLSVPAQKDEPGRPTLAAYYLSRRTVASLAADGVLDSARIFLSSVTRDLGVILSHESINEALWFKAVRGAASRAGLAWSAATRNHTESVWGDTEAFTVLAGLGEDEKAALIERDLSCVVNPAPRPPTFHVIRLNLSRSNYQLWFGVERPRFGAELDFSSPWRLFLEDLAQLADASLESIQQRQKAELERARAVQNQGMMTIAVTTGTLMHQLINMVRAQISAVEDLEEASRYGEIKLDDKSANLLGQMRYSAQQMQRLTRAFRNLAKIEGRRPCSLRDAAVEAKGLFRLPLEQRGIKIEVDVAATKYADVEFYVVAFALANLFGNAIDALTNNGNSGGSVAVTVEDDERHLLCHVADNGPGIPKELRDKIFNMGMSSKDGHNGWGLYFTKQSLAENGSDIFLAESRNGAKFTLRLPKSS